MIRSLALALAFVLTACGAPKKDARPAEAPPAITAEAVFAGGCFWCAEHDLEKLEGVVEVVSGYTGGDNENPTYENHPGHYEAVRVVYDPSVIGYRELVDAFWPLIDPTDAGGQFCDRGPAYRTAIFVTPEQRSTAEASKAAIVSRVSDPIVTPVLDLETFWEAEDYHQDYADKNPVRYRFYRNACGRDARLREVWG
jgi:peptide-methionine (S)-S-oxide reductase